MVPNVKNIQKSSHFPRRSSFPSKVLEEKEEGRKKEESSNRILVYEEVVIPIECAGER